MKYRIKTKLPCGAMGPNRSRGVSVIELMVAVMLGLIVVAVMGGSYLSNKKTFMTSSQTSRIQENARFAMEYILKDARMAGFVGCSQNMNNLLNQGHSDYSPALFDPTAAASGWEYIGTAPSDSYTVPDPWTVGTGTASDWNSAGEDMDPNLLALVMPGTDVLVIKRLEGPIVATPANNNNIKNNNLGLNQNSNVLQDTIVLVTNCQGGDLFQNVSNDNATTMSSGTRSGVGPGNDNKGKWSQKWQETDEIYLMSSNAYFIGQGASGAPALFRLEFDRGVSGLGNPVELIEGVENLQVLFGDDTDGDGVANGFVTGDALPDPTRVVSIRVSMLFRSLEETQDVADTTIRFDLTNGLTIPNGATPDNASMTLDPHDDRHIRYATSNTIKLRNRGLQG